MVEAVSLVNVGQPWQADGRLAANAAATSAMLDELLRWTRALQTLRAK